MESTVLNRPFTFRVENIPPETTAEELIKYFYTEDQPRLRVRSIVPAVDSYKLDVREYTATITFQATNPRVSSPRLLDEDLSIDCDFHGFTPLNHPQEPIAADIIAVTGLAAHAFGSWAHSTQNMWLRDYLPRDVSNARVLIYGYPLQLHGNVSRSILSDHSSNMIHRLLTMRESAKCQDRPIVFIGHSLGCLIIKKVLCDINGSVGIYSSRLPVRTIIFLGAPHKGLETTALETLVKSQATEDMIRELKAESPTLTELNDKFRHVAKDIDILTCYELSPTKTAIEMPDGSWKREGPPMMMVSLDSARQWYPREEFVACNADHTQIAKLKRGENSIYPSVRWAIKKALLSAGDLYSEAKGASPSDPSHFRGLDESTLLRQSVLQVSHRQSPMISNGRSANPTSVPSRPPLEDDVDQQIGRLHQAEIDQSAHTGETQSGTDSFNEAVAQWQIGIDDSKQDDTWSSTNPSSPAGADIASVTRDEDGPAVKESNLTPPLDTGAAAPRDPSEEAISEHPKIERSINEIETVATKDSNVTDRVAKSMIFDEVLTSAVIKGDEQKTRELLEHSYHIECKSGHGITPLLTAARYRLENIARMLLEHGADLRARSNEGLTALHRLALFPTIPIPETLIDLILEYRPPLDASTKSGRTPLMIACGTGESLLAKKLIHHGADVRAVDEWRRTPLHYAASGMAMVISIMVNSGAEIDARIMESFQKQSPLHKAAPASEDPYDTVKELLLAGADKEARTSTLGFTPLLNAAWYCNEACVARLLENGVDVNASAEDGETSLHKAARKGHVGIVKTLLDHGANPTIKSSYLWGDKASTVSMDSDVSSTPKKEIRSLLKEAEKAWKQSNGK